MEWMMRQFESWVHLYSAGIQCWWTALDSQHIVTLTRCSVDDHCGALHLAVRSTTVLFEVIVVLMSRHFTP
jgi:hypothetical protein